MLVHLYVKIHNVTGLRYFGKTRKNPFTYSGSGKYWKRHLKVHGNDLNTVLIGSYNEETEKDKLIADALTFSEQNNIATSKEWANLKPENGLDGGTFSEYISAETRQKMSISGRGKIKSIGWKHSEESKKKMKARARMRCQREGPPKSAFRKGHVPVNKGIPLSAEEIEKARIRALSVKPATCNICGKTTNPGNISRWHGVKCKMK